MGRMQAIGMAGTVTRRGGLAAALAVLALSAPLAGETEGAVAENRSEDGWMSAQSVMAPPPDEAAVLAQEFRGAVDDGSNAALIRFIARHPDRALARQAWQRLAGRTVPDGQPLAGDPDAMVYAAFDAARLAGTAAAYRGFAQTYAGHPLAEEASRQARALP